jgi:hypothetical protein
MCGFLTARVIKAVGEPALAGLGAQRGAHGPEARPAAAQ